eukprot:5818865-Pyramimonas_sp.AAC.1
MPPRAGSCSGARRKRASTRARSTLQAPRDASMTTAASAARRRPGPGSFRGREGRAFGSAPRHEGASGPGLLERRGHVQDRPHRLRSREL